MTKAKAIVKSDVPAHLAKIEDKGAGFEDMSQRDIQFPKIRIAQPSSDIAAEGKMKPGQVYEDVSNSLILDKDEMTEFAIAFWFKSWVEWSDIDSGEGVIESSTDPKSALASRAARGEQREGKQGKMVPVVTEYHNFIVMLRDQPGKLFQMSCFRTNHKHGRKLLNMARMREKPIYAGVYSVAPAFKQRDAYKWFEFDFENAGWGSEEEFNFLADRHEELKALHEAARIDHLVEDAPDAPKDDADAEY